MPDNLESMPNPFEPKSDLKDDLKKMAETIENTVTDQDREKVGKKIIEMEGKADRKLAEDKKWTAINEQLSRDYAGIVGRAMDTAGFGKLPNGEYSATPKELYDALMKVKSATIEGIVSDFKKDGLSPEDALNEVLAAGRSIEEHVTRMALEKEREILKRLSE